MSSSRTTRCIISALQQPWISPRTPCQKLHVSSRLNKSGKRKTKSIKAEDMGLIPNFDRSKPADELFKTYDADEKQILKNIFTEEQYAAIEAGEEAVDFEDLKNQACIRSDTGRLNYFDDLSQSRAAIDCKKEYDGPYDPDMREPTIAENIAAALEASEKVLESEPDMLDQDLSVTNQSTSAFDDGDDSDQKFTPIVSRLNIWKIQDTMSLAMGKNGPIPRDHGQMENFTAPGLPRSFLSKKKTALKDEEENDVRDPDGVYNKLIAQTGLTLDEILSYKIKVLVQHRVSNQTRLGKIPGQYVLAVAGNGNGRLGLGQAKGTDGGQTLNLAKISAIKNMQPIPRYEDRTIFGEVEAKVSAVRVKLMARPPGFGLRCQHLIFEMARAAGIQDLAARVPHARNKMNTCKAVYKALLGQPNPDDIARGRGKKLVDVRKVYYGGQI